MQTPVILPAFAVAMALAFAPTSAQGWEPHVPVVVALTTAPSVAPEPLRIEVEKSLEDASFISAWINGRHPKLAEELPFVEGHAQWIAVTIGGATYDYRVTVTAIRDGAPVGAAREPEVCECNIEGLLELVDTRIAEELAVLRAAPVPEVASDREEAPPVTAALDSRELPTGPPERLRVSPTGIAGAAMGVLGAGLISVGAWLAPRSKDIRGTTPYRIEIRSTRVAGRSLALAGGLVFAAGMSMLVMDLVRLRRQRQRQLAIVPVLEHHELGVAITWRARGRVGR